MPSKYTKKGGHGGTRKGAGAPGVPKPPPIMVNAKDFRPLALRCRDYDHLALQTLISALHADDCPWPSKVAAANTLWDRGHGKPLNVTAKMDINAFAGWTNEQLDHLLNDLRAIRGNDRGAGAAKTIEGVPLKPAGVVQTAGPETGPSSSPDTKRPRGNNGQSH